MENMRALGKGLPKYAPPPKMELLMEDLMTSGKSSARIPPGLEPLKEDLGTLGKGLPRIPPRTGTSHSWTT